MNKMCYNAIKPNNEAPNGKIALWKQNMIGRGERERELLL